MDGKTTRRRFIRTGATATAGILGVAAVDSRLASAAAPATKVASLAAIKPWAGVSFLYPDSQAAMLLELGKAAPGGVGPGRSIVAYSTLCQHMGCPVVLDQASKLLVCPCHNSTYDPARQGRALAGPAIEGLPMITLKVENGAVYAVGVAPVRGVSSGLVYGLACDDK